MAEQFKLILTGPGKKRVLLLVLIFSMILLGSVIGRFAAQNKWLEDEFATQVQNTEQDNELAMLSLYMKAGESAEQGYAISGDRKFMESFDSGIDSIRSAYLQVQQLEKRKKGLQNDALFARYDSLVRQEYVQMQQIKTLSDENDRKAARALIATNKGLILSDSIAKISKEISDKIYAQLKKSQAGFLKVRNSNNNLAYFSMAASMLLIALVFYFLIKEINKAKKISGDLELRKENYRVTLNSLGEGLISTDKEGNILYMNSAAERLTGWKWQEAKKKPLHTVFNVVNEKTGKPVEHIVSRILKEGKKVGWENNTLLKSKDSGAFIISNSGSPLLDANGNIAGAVLVFDDITERKKAEEEIRKSEEKYRNLVEEASDAILIHSFDGTIHEFNKSCYTLLGYSQEEYAKLKLSDILVEDIIVNQANYAAVLAGDTKTVYRHLKRKDGSLIETEARVKVLADGKVISFARDITDRKKAEEAIKKEKELSDSVINCLPGTCYVFDETGKFLRWNSKFESVSGYSPAEIINMHPIQFFSSEETGYITERIGEAFTKGESEAEALLVTKDQRRIPYYFTGLRMHYEGKLCLLGIGIDITERKKAEKEVVRSHKQFQNLVESISGVYWVTDLETNRTLYVSPSYEYITGKKAEDLYDNQQDFINAIHPDDREYVVTTYKNISGTDKINICYRIIKPGGEIRWISAKSSILIDSNGHKTEYGYAEDITERKKAEEAIQKEKDLLESVINSLPGVFYLLDKNLKYLRWNKNFETVTGYSADEIASLHPLDLFDNDEKGLIVEKIKEVLTEGEVYLDASFYTKDGQKIPYYLTGFKTENDGETQLLGVGIDITQRKKAEEELRSSEETIKLIMNSALDAIISMDMAGIITAWTLQAEKIFGWKAEEVTGKPVSETIIPAKYREQHYNGMQEYLKTGESRVINKLIEITALNREGQEFPVEMIIAPITHGGSAYFCAFIRDITERKKAEAITKTAIERYEILARATSDTIWDWDIANNTILYNEGIYKMFRYNLSEIENVVEWWNEKLHPDDFKKIAESLDDIFEKGIQRFQLTYRFRCADGSYKHIFDRAFVVVDESGKPCRIIGAMQDITYQAEEEIRVTKAIIDAQEEERRNIGAELHDNVNQILVGSILTLGMAKEKQNNIEKASELIDAARGYIVNAIDEIRKLSHQLAPAAFDDNSLQEIFETLLSTINLDNRFTINLYFDQLNETVISDDIQINLYRILQEQIKNILKYSEASALEVAITLPGNAVRMRIYDNGKGFDTKTFRNGIGLNNIKKRAESLSGKFILNSAPGNGCEIIVEIPLST
ncbi:MAG: PAS domain S-box protein [Bacteroidota bacterium]|nr:PAS domain S-box protein [Bacteroidota bacterium]